MRFFKLSLDDNLPDHAVLSRFRSQLSPSNAWDPLLQLVHGQLKQDRFMLTKGVYVDAPSMQGKAVFGYKQGTL